MAKTTISFTLDTERDRRLIRWLDGLPFGRRSGAIREALTAHLGRTGVTNKDILDAIRELGRGGIVVTQGAGPKPQQGELPQEILDNLAGLGL